MTDRFPICIPFTLAQEQVVQGQWTNERNYSVDPVPTFNGIEQTEFWEYLKLHGLPEVPVKQMTQLEGYAIYRSKFWLPYCPSLPPGLDLQFFDSAVNEGQKEAIQVLQVALGIQKDGIWGPVTAAAVQQLTNVRAAIQGFTARRKAVYVETPYHGADAGEVHADWQRRATEIGAEALKMVG